MQGVKAFGGFVSGGEGIISYRITGPKPNLEKRAVVEVDAGVHRGDAAGDGYVLGPTTEMKKVNAHR